jgi:hypothetical protein
VTTEFINFNSITLVKMKSLLSTISLNKYQSLCFRFLSTQAQHILQKKISTKFEFWIFDNCTRLCRFCWISSFRVCLWVSDRINDFCIPTRKHFANRQQLHIRRDLYVIEQSPSFLQIKSIFCKKKHKRIKKK